MELVSTGSHTGHWLLGQPQEQNNKHYLIWETHVCIFFLSAYWWEILWIMKQKSSLGNFGAFFFFHFSDSCCLWCNYFCSWITERYNTFVVVGIFMHHFQFLERCLGSEKSSQTQISSWPPEKTEGVEIRSIRDDLA